MAIGREQMTVGDIVSGAVRTWFANFSPLFIISAVFSVPIFLVNSLVASGFPETAEDLDAVDVGDLLVRTLTASFVSVLLSALLTAGLVHAFLRLYRGDIVAPGESIRAVFDNIIPIVVFGLITGIVTALGFVFLVIPGILAIILFSLGIPALLDERRSGTDAIARCFNLITGNWGVAFGVVFVGFLITIVAGFILGGISSPGSVSSASDVGDVGAFRIMLQVAASALLAPLIPSLATALYFEVKGRNEGFPSINEEPLSDWS